MKTEQKIEAIYKEIANKELIGECFSSDDEYKKIVSKKLSEAFKKQYKFDENHMKIGMEMMVFQNQIFVSGIQMISKEEKVMIGDFLHWMGEKTEKYFNHDIHEVLVKWENKLKAIEKQSEECIDYVYNLIK